MKITLKHLKYSYGNHILGEINFTIKLVKNLLLNYFEFNFLKCSYFGMKHTFQTTTDIIFSPLPTLGSQMQQHEMAAMIHTEDLSYQHILCTICLSDWTKMELIQGGAHAAQIWANRHYNEFLVSHLYWKRSFCSWRHVWENNIEMDIINYTAILSIELI